MCVPANILACCLWHNRETYVFLIEELVVVSFWDKRCTNLKVHELLQVKVSEPRMLHDFGGTTVATQTAFDLSLKQLLE